jgi:hypothetical protein
MAVTIAILALLAQVVSLKSPEAKFWEWFKAKDAAFRVARLHSLGPTRRGALRC